MNREREDRVPVTGETSRQLPKQVSCVGRLDDGLGLCRAKRGGWEGGLNSETRAALIKEAGWRTPESALLLFIRHSNVRPRSRLGSAPLVELQLGPDN